MRKPAEIWIEFGGDPSNDVEIYKRYSAKVPFQPTSHSDEVIHCIEKRAYDEAITELKSLQSECGYASPWWIRIEKIVNPANPVLKEPAQ